jgi:4-hydroxybenzoate polyprenyltransferase
MSAPSSDSALKTGFGAALCHDPALVGGVAVALMLGTYGLFGVPVDVPLVIAGFCGTTLTYLLDRVWADTPEDRVNRPGRVAWVRAHPRWLAAEMGLLFALGGAMGLYLAPTTLVWGGALGLVAGGHVVRRGQQAGALRWVPKPVVLAGAWAVGGALLPLVEAGRPLGGEALLFCGYRGAFILPNLLLADWADRDGDAAVGLRPWAAGWSIRQVRWAATASLLVAGGAAMGWGAFGAAPVLVAIDAAGLLLMVGVVWGPDPERPRSLLLADLVVAWPLVPALVAWMSL